MSKESKGIIKNPCKQCGSEAIYSATKQKMVCGHCGYEEAIEIKQDKIIEKSFHDALPIEDHATGMGAEKMEFTCRSCGAITMVDETAVVLTCPFCGSSNVNVDAHKHRVITPEGILLFKIDKNKAYQAFKKWIGSGWFHPNDLKNVTTLEKIQGVYVPFWTYDAQTESYWTAEAGYYYYETEYVTDANGEQKAVQVQKVRWIPVAGDYNHFFDDVTVVASKGITQDRIQKIYPYDFKQLINYEPKLLVGWQSELYGIDVKKGFQIADKIMDEYIYNECAKLIPGDTYRFLEVRTHKYDITFKHILLPVWISAYRYNGKVYQVVVNGQTGKISGEKPLSWTKIFFFILFIIGLMFIIFIIMKAR